MSDDYTAKLTTYLDGELPAAEMKAVDAHLRNCPSCAADLLGQVQMKRALQSASRRYAPSPEFRARIQRQIASQPRAYIFRLWLTAASVLALMFLAFLAATYLGRRTLEREHAFSEIADLHVATLASASRVDVVSTDRHTVKPWFQGKIPFSFNLPELQGSDFALIGGRVTYLGQAPGAHLIYEIRKHQISVFIFQDRDVNASLGSNLGVHRHRSFEVDSWSQNGLRYFLIGDANPEDIRALALRFKAADRG
jgi:anti-sigma factor RsiW